MDSERGHGRKLLVALNEFLGVLFFMYIVVVGGVTGSDTWGISGPLALFVMINIFGGISGGHFNPCVSLGVYVREAEWGKNLAFLFMYILAQICGAICGMLLATLAVQMKVNGENVVPLEKPLLLPTKFDIAKLKAGDEMEKNEIWEVTYMEILPAFVFVLFILFVTGKKTQVPDLGTFGIFGICLNLWALCNVDWYTACSVNPALAIGGSIFQYWHWSYGNRELLLFYLPWYVIGACLGGIFAGLFYHWLASNFPDKDEHEKVHQAADNNSYGSGAINH